MIKKIIQFRQLRMQFLKSKESLSFEGFSNSSPKEEDPEHKPPSPQSYQPPNNYIILKYYSRFIQLSKIYCISLLMQIFLNILYYELDYRGDVGQALTISKFLLVNGFFSMLANFLTFFSHNDWRIVEGKSEKKIGLTCFLITQTVVITQPYEWLEDIYINNWNYRDNTDIPYKLNYLLTSLALFKIVLIIYSMNYYFKFNNSKNSIILNKHQPRQPYLFSLKCLFKHHPIGLVCSLFVISILFFSFAYRISERNKSLIPNAFEYYDNCIWMVFISMTTVGYGDFTPITSIGRTYGFFCTFYGVIIVSITVLVVINTFQMDSAERETLKILKNLSDQRLIRKLAAQYIRQSLWRIWKNKKLRKKNMPQLLQTRNEKVKKNILKETIRISKYNDPNEKNLGVQMTREFQRVIFYLHNLNHNFDTIINYLGEQNVLNLSKLEKGYENILKIFQFN